MTKPNLFLLLALTLLSSCGIPTYIISNDSLTVIDPANNRRYVDVDKIEAIPAGKAIFQVETESDLFIRADQELVLKTGWTLRGKTGLEALIKEQSATTSAIRIQQASGVILKDLHITTTGIYTQAKRHALVLVDNEAGMHQGIAISGVHLSGHFSGVTIRRGDNISIEDCHLSDNGHQIYLGDLDVDRAEIKNYRVDDVQILRTTISNSKLNRDSTGHDGIKTRSNCTNIKIDNCRITNNWGDGIDLFPGGLDVEITNNVLSHNRVHGVEVKMDDQYREEETGKARRVIISGNRMIKNGNNGIRIYDDSLNTNYARGIVVDSNFIDSSGHYGIEARLPVVISSNYLRGNGLEIQEESPEVGYTGIYLLNVVRPGEIAVTDNQVIDQAPISTAKTTYWISLNNIDCPITFKGNKLDITGAYSDSFSVAPYGISLIGAHGSPPPDSLKSNNSFTTDFICRVVASSLRCQY